jgi:ribosomal protein S18 acetylase RimI-like enzyme
MRTHHLKDPPMKIRAVTRDDLPALKGVIDATELFPSQLIDDMIEGYLSGTTEEFWLTMTNEAHGNPIAVAYCAPERMTQGTWNLLLIALHPDQQGRGHGTALISHIENKLRENGQRILLVETSGLPSFERMRAFYSKCGYDNEACIRDFYDAGEDKVVFRKALTTLTV